MDFCRLPVSQALDFMERLSSRAPWPSSPSRFCGKFARAFAFAGGRLIVSDAFARGRGRFLAARARESGLQPADWLEPLGVLYILDEASISLHQRDNDNSSIRCAVCAIWETRFLSSTRRGHHARGGFHRRRRPRRGHPRRRDRRGRPVDDIIAAPRLHYWPVPPAQRKFLSRLSGAREMAKNSKILARRKTICSTWMSFLLGTFIWVTVSGSGKSS